MKEIQNYVASKYSDEKYSLVENGIYQTEEDGEKLYLTSLYFVQEPELGEEAMPVKSLSIHWRTCWISFSVTSRIFTMN